MLACEVCEKIFDSGPSTISTYLQDCELMHILVGARWYHAFQCCELLIHL